MTNASAAKHSLIPWVVWSASKAWLLAPLAFFISLPALVLAAGSWRSGKAGRFTKTVTLASALLLAAIAVFIFYRVA